MTVRHQTAACGPFGMEVTQPEPVLLSGTRAGMTRGKLKEVTEAYLDHWEDRDAMIQAVMASPPAKGWD